MDPTGPSQPNIDTAYSTSGNPTDQTPQEQSNSAANASTNSGSLVDQREAGDVPVPSTHNNGATPSSLGYGARDASGDKGESVGPSASNVDGEQMAVLGEGKVADAQDNKTGFGEQQDLASDLDRKKAEQSGKREAVKAQREGGADIAGAVGGQSGPGAVEGSIY